MINRVLFLALLTAAACGSSSPTASSLELSSVLPETPVAGTVVTVSVLAKLGAAPVAGVHVAFAVTAGNGTMLDPNATTGANGVATARWTLGKLAGGQTVVATADGAPALTVNATAVVGPVATVAVSAPASELRIGETLKLTAQVLDANGNLIAQNPTWASASTAIATVSADGTVAGAGQGDVVVQASFGGVSGSVKLTVSGLLSGAGTATIDGTLSSAEWANAASTAIGVNVAGGTTPGRLWVMNDSTNLYLAVSFDSAAADFGSSVSFEFDVDGNGTVSVGDDFIILNPALAFIDGARSNEPPCPAGGVCAPGDTSVGGTNDGAAAFTNDGTSSIYEFRHPLNSGDSHDFALHSGSVIGTNVAVTREPQNNGALFDTSFPEPLGAPGSYLQVTIR